MEAYGRYVAPLTNMEKNIYLTEYIFRHAAGLLLTYNPPVKTDQNGIATKSALVQHSNSFTTMFRSLIEAVPLFDETDWFMSLASLQQWHLLVER